MPEAVVDDLEAVEVEEQHARRPRAPAEAEERLAEAVEEQRAVRQPGQRVVEGLVLESVLRRGPLDRDGGERGDALDERDLGGVGPGSRAPWMLSTPCRLRVRAEDRHAPLRRRLPVPR